MEQCAGDSSESRKCLKLSSSPHQYTAARERRFITTRCTMRPSPQFWKERTKIKETITTTMTLLCLRGQLHQQHLILIIFCPKNRIFSNCLGAASHFCLHRRGDFKIICVQVGTTYLNKRVKNCHTKSQLVQMLTTAANSNSSDFATKTRTDISTHTRHITSWWRP